MALLQGALGFGKSTAPYSFQGWAEPGGGAEPGGHCWDAGTPGGRQPWSETLAARSLTGQLECGPGKPVPL